MRSGRGISWRPYGRRGVLVELPDLAAVHELHRAVVTAGFASECVPGALTLYVESDMNQSALVDAINALPADTTHYVETAAHVISVVYDGEDLAGVAELTGLSLDEVIRRHTSPTYTVAFLGFSRGFPYLSGLDPLLVVARLDTPRTSVPAGSVAMGSGFTGVYPMSSPGGWRLLGHTDQRFFDENREPPSLLAVGDLVRFERVVPGHVGGLQRAKRPGEQ
jgi:5-oxoprolinase (ATP-hydrolysing) subunit B